jgi:hypothetical protein
VNEEESAEFLNNLARMVTGFFEWCNRCSNNGSTGFGQLGRDKCNACNILVAICAAEAKFRGEF